jgi:hypothetical protein
MTYVPVTTDEASLTEEGITAADEDVFVSAVVGARDLGVDE